MSRPTGVPARRTWSQRLLIGCNALALLAAAVTAGTLAYSNDRLSEVERVDLSAVTAAEEMADGDPQNYLIVGVDDASGLSDGDNVKVREASDLAGQHTDTIMVVRVDPARATAQLLSLPRDLWVPIAGADTNQRINTALATGGAERLIRTIDQDFGIPIHHYVQVDFADFKTLVDVVDGIPVHFPRPARAPSSGLVIEEPGCWTLGPGQALGFSRARKDYQVQADDGEWYTDPGVDFSRVRRQQLFVELALRRAIAKGARNPNTLRQLVDLGVGTVRIDDALEGSDLVALGTRFRSFNPADLETFTLPVTDDVVGGAQVLFLQEEAAEPVLSIFRGVAPAAPGRVRPEDVTVAVRNGTATEGQAGDVTSRLAAAGFETLVPADSEIGLPTMVLYDAGAEAKAQLVARHLIGPVQYQQSATLEGADVVVVTGTDWAGVVAVPRAAEEVAAPPTPTTTVPEAVPGETSTTAGGSTPEVEQGDPDDPDDPRFYQAAAPAPGETCERTG